MVLKHIIRWIDQGKVINERQARADSAHLLPELDSYTAVGIAEGWLEAESYDHHIAAWQYLIDTGLAWKMEPGSRKAAQLLVDHGICVEKEQEDA